VAVRASQNKAEDIWIHDIDRSVKSLLTTDNPLRDNRPVWSPDGAYVAYTAVGSESGYDFVQRRADGSGEVEPIVTTPMTEQPTDWSVDGEYILYQQDAPGRRVDILYLRRMEGGGYGDPKACLASSAREVVAKLSSDSRYVAYCTNESGRDEVYVQRFPQGGEKTQISTNGGTQPRWSRGGSELFFVEGDGLMAVQVVTSPHFAAGPPKLLFRHPSLFSLVPEQMYDVSSDGQRFVVVETLEPEDELPVVHVVENWYAEFRGRE
jgi:serine/threonine-protein kinase